MLIKNETASIELKHRQVDHFWAVVRMLERQHFYLDTSIMGTGKTYIAAAVAIYFKLPLFVIGVLASKDVWEDIAKKSGVPLVDFLTYERLAGSKRYPNIQDYLQRQDVGTTVYYQRTEKLIKMCDNGILCVVDEIQKVKNDVARTKAIREVVRTINASEVSRCGLLSGTPMDKPEQIVNMLRILGYVKYRRLYNIGPKRSLQYEDQALGEIIREARKLDKNKANELIVKNTITIESVDGLIHDLFINVFKPKVMISMDPITFDVNIDIKNGYYFLEPDDEKNLRDGIKELKDNAGIVIVGKNYQATSAFNGNITKSLMKIEGAKVNIISRNVRHDLIKHRTTKVVVYVSYIKNLEKLETLLKEFKPLVLQGKVPPNQRTKVIDSFQRDSSRRLLLGNIVVGGAALSLHDTIGDTPRIMYLVPNFNIIDLHQATRRIIREGLKSDVKIRFVYGLGHVMETNILNALARKTDFMGQILDKQVEHHVKFPGDYENEIETEQHYLECKEQ